MMPGADEMTEERQSRYRNGIAIIGMAGKFPGASTVRQFWRNLMDGVESIRFASDAELTESGVDAGLRSKPDYVPASSTIDGPEMFDASFFGLSAREAEIIDPQQRIFLECAWEALEDAAYDPANFPGSIGVFAGAGMNTYGISSLANNPEVIASVGPYQIMVGNDKDFLCSRIAYKLNLRGPAVGVQTACSTSLVAVQVACESLLRGECDIALAGGVSIALPQPSGYLYVPGMILSRDGHCRAFDAAASGTVPGAGAGIVVLKPLSAAIEEGDHIYAVIRGAAINNDGSAKAGYSAPSVEGQSSVIHASMKMAGFSADSIRYVEAHGTGTEVGDPIEVAALAKVFSGASTRPRSCALGSLKTNIGHLDAAAGVAGLIKAALAVKHRTIPPTLHFTQPNPLMELDKTPFHVNTSPVKIEGEQPFRVGVSSFGIGGTNAHVSLEQPPSQISDPSAVSQLILISAKSSAALDDQASQLADYLDESPSVNLADLAFTLQKGRRAFSHRRVLVAKDAAQLTAALRLPRSQSPGPQLLRTDSAPTEPTSIAFLFPGQGSQYVNMGRGLYETAPVFRDTVDRCCKLLEPHLSFDLRRYLYPESSGEEEAERQLSQTQITQPALFVVEYAMATLWMACGIVPNAMVGHSVGEYVAACIAGVFSLEDALGLIAARGRLIQSMPPGAMLAVSLPEQDAAALLPSELSIAAVNSPGQTVVSGIEPSIAALELKLKNKKIDCRRLRTSHAFHSAMMEPILEEFIGQVAKVYLQAPKLRYLSNVTGAWITDEQATDPSYWAKHIRNGVRFADCGGKLLREGNSVLLEVGPGDTLLSLMRPLAATSGTHPMLTSMRHRHASQPDRDHWLTTAGRLWLASVRMNWDGLHRNERRVRIALPTYPFERQRYWIEPKKTTALPENVPLAKQADIADWFYVPSWKRTPAEILRAPKAEVPATWLLLLSANDDRSQSLAGALAQRGQVITLYAGRGFRKNSPDSFEVDPASREDYLRLLQELQASGRWPDKIVHAWLRDREPDIARAIDFGVSGALALVQAIEECSSVRSVEFNILSECAYSLMGEPASSPASNALHAFCKVVALECPNVVCRVIDIEPDSQPALVQKQIVRELLSPAANETVAYRGTARWTQCYEPVRLEKSTGAASSEQSIQLKDRGAYVITGGLGGIGLVLAEHLARTVNARLVFTSRTAFPDSAEWQKLLDSPETADDLRGRIRGLQSIQNAGGKVLVLQVDTSDAAGMQKTISTARMRYGPIRGIIHAAGVAGTAMCQTKSPEQALAVLSPKLQGTEWIKECLGAPELDFVLLCSSISAVVPSFGLSDYAAANAYLDGFAIAHDNPKGTRVISAGWDTWAEVGMAVTTPIPGASVQQLADRLKHAILSQEALDVFDRLLQYPQPHVVISTRGLHSLLRQSSAALETFRSMQQTPAAAVATHSRPESMENYAEADDDIERFIVATWQELLGIAPIGIHDDFFQLGGHSLLGTQVLARVRDRFKIDLSLRTIFEAATPAELANRVRLTSWASAPAASAKEMEREEIEI
jgi:acyl transferase domain-containing protein